MSQLGEPGAGAGGGPGSKEATQTPRHESTGYESSGEIGLNEPSVWNSDLSTEAALTEQRRRAASERLEAQSKAEAASIDAVQASSGLIALLRMSHKPDQHGRIPQTYSLRSTAKREVPKHSHQKARRNASSLGSSAAACNAAWLALPTHCALCASPWSLV